MNIEQYVTTSPNPTVIIEQVGGNLTVQGWEESRVWIRGEGQEYNVEHEDGDKTAEEGNETGSETGGQVTIRLEHDGRIFVPTASSLIINTAHGNAEITQVEGEIIIERVHGNLAMQGTGPVTIETVSGNFAAKQISGDLTAERVYGNGAFQAVDGNVIVEKCHGELSVRQVAGDVQSSVSANANLRLAPQPGHTIAVDAHGNINCRIPATTQSRVTLSAGGHVNVKHLPLRDGGANQRSFTLGEGTGQITLEARGNVSLAGTSPEEDDGTSDFDYDFDFDFDHDVYGQTSDMMRQFSEQMEAHARELARHFEARMNDLNSGDEIASRVQEKVQRALRQAEEKIAQAARRAEEKATRQAERAAARAERRGHKQRGPMPRHAGSPSGSHSGSHSGMAYSGVHTPPVPPVPPVPPRAGGNPGAQGPARATSIPPREPVSDEERMHILRMLEEGKISVDQAETLLAALEG